MTEGSPPPESVWSGLQKASAQKDEEDMLKEHAQSGTQSMYHDMLNPVAATALKIKKKKGHKHG
jgi:hypothetical protein